MERIELEVADIHSAAQPAEAFSLILKEKEGNRYVPVIIGMSEARAILVEMNQSPTRRPLTHELFITLADQYGCSLVEVDIIHYENGVYYADMLLLSAESKTFHIDARPSDAVAIALKLHAPIFMKADIFAANAQQEEPEEELEFSELAEAFRSPAPPPDEDPSAAHPDYFINQKLSEMSVPELEDLLQGAIESEDYELAAKIQSELDRRK